jgi:hypothetical protein
MAKTRNSTARKTKSKPANKATQKRTEEMSRSAAKLIDQAAGLLKRSISTGLKKSEKGREIFKDKAHHSVAFATKNLITVLEKGSEYLRKGIRKL